MEIWEKLVTPNQTVATKSLIQDDNTKFMMLKSLGQKFLQTEEIFVLDSTGQFTLLLANAPFLRSDQECMQMNNIVQWGMKINNILPMITERECSPSLKA